MMKAGVYVYGIASIAAGVTDLIWDAFEPGHQAIQAFGDHIPGVGIFAFLAGIWLVAGGAAILWRRTARGGAVALAIIYCIFAVFWFPRFYTAPHFLGYRFTVYVGVLDGICQQLILVVAAAIVYASSGAPGSLSPNAARIARWAFGLCAVDFGLAHLTGVQDVAPLVPKWMPLGADFWTVLTGGAFVLAGLAILSGIRDVLAARLLALMLLVFSVLVLSPMIFASPREQAAWGGNAYNLAAVAAAWIVADWLAARQQPVQSQHAATAPTPSLA
jgi:uncharacterized membrane protein YphA (DoxX/SURF4 family)